MRGAPIAVVSSVLAGCALAYPFSDVAPDEKLPISQNDSGANDSSNGGDVVVAANDAGGDGAVPTSGKVRWVTVLDQGIADYNASVWGDIRAHIGGGFVAFMSVESADAGGTTDVALMRLDANGKVEWTKTFGGAGDEEAHTVVSDAVGNIWISGGSSSNPSLFTSVANPNARKRPFAAKLDANGNLLFATALDPTGITDATCQGLAIGAAETYVGCRFDGTIALTKTTDEVVQYASKSSTSDLLLARVDPSNGKFVWSDVYGGTSSEVLWDLVPIGNAHVIASGWFLSPSFSPTNRTRIGAGENAFVIELDGTTALPSWIRTWGLPASGNFVRTLAAAGASDGAVVVGGDFKGTFDVGAAGNATALTRAGWWAFVDRDKQGLEKSFVSINDAWSSIVRGVAILPAGDVVATGELEASSAPTVGGHALGFSGEDRASGFVVRASQSGKVVYTRSWISNTGIVLPRRVSVGPNGEPVIFGTFTGRVDFGDGIPRTAGTNGSVFFVALEP